MYRRFLEFDGNKHITFDGNKHIGATVKYTLIGKSKIL